MKYEYLRPTSIYIAGLLLLGIVGFLVTGMQSITALIPAFFGIVVAVVMFILRRLAEASVVAWTLFALAVVGLVATMMGIPKLLSWVMGQETARPAAVISQSIMAVMSLVYALIVLFGAKSASKRS